MLELVVTHNEVVFRYLGTAAFQRLGIEVHGAASHAQAEALVSTHRPQVALLDTGLGGDAYALCRRIKDAPELASTRVMLMATAPLSPAILDAIASSGCDDVVGLPGHADDFYRHLAQVAGLPHRRHHRVPVSVRLEVALTRDDAPPLEGKVINLSPRGAGIEVDRLVDRGEAMLHVVFGDDTPPPIRCRVAWCHPSHRQGNHFAGIDFIEIPAATRALLEQLALFEGSRGDDGSITIAVQGDFDERTEFSTLAKLLAPEPVIDFDLRAVRYIGSSGVRAWCQFLDSLGDRDISFRQCSVAFTSQAAMVPRVVGSGRVVSVEAPYHCHRCERDELRLVQTALLVRRGASILPPPFRCRACSDLLEFDEIPERYFAFLEDAPHATREGPTRKTAMSFLRKMFGGGVAANDPRQFLVESMLGAMEADGDVTEEELLVLERNMSEHELFAELSADARTRLIDAAADSIRKAGGGSERAPAIAAGLPSRGHRLTAFAMACEICVSDAELPEGEIRYLEALQKALAVDEETAREVFEAVRQESGLETVEEKAAQMRELMPSFVDCMALMAVADGEVHDEELAGLRAVLERIPDMAVLTSDELDGAIVASFARIRGRDVSEQLAAVATKIEGATDRYWTTVYMMIIARADGTTHWREVAFLQTAQKTFGLDDEQMDQAMATAALFPTIDLGGAPA